MIAFVKEPYGSRSLKHTKKYGRGYKDDVTVW